MEIWDIVQMVWPFVAGGGLGWMLKSNRRKAAAEADAAEAQANSEEWQVYKDQISHLVEISKTESDLIKELTERHAEERAEKEQRFNEQTDRLREVQRSLVAANNREIEATREIGRLRLLVAHLKNWHCRRDFEDCQRREPEQEMKTPYKEIE